jgi:hypothetical protein
MQRDGDYAEPSTRQTSAYATPKFAGYIVQRSRGPTHMADFRGYHGRLPVWRRTAALVPLSWILIMCGISALLWTG